MNQVKEFISTLRGDQVGIVLSVLCMIHCIGLPLMLVFSPSLAHSHDDFTHLIFFFLVAGLAFYSFYKGYKIHKGTLPAWLGTLGVALIFFAMFAPHEHFLGVFTMENLVTTLGGIILIYAHVLNIRDCRCACCK